MIGKTILHYKVLQELGRGGMGVVYLAEDTKLKRRVAIKFLPHHVSANKEERQRFEIEAQAAAALNHPNITHIYAIEEVNEQLFIVMEYIEGRELKEIISNPPSSPLSKGGQEGGCMSIESALSIATQIAEGLQAAHEKGIVHRDIKSSNIIISNEGQVEIMDFGLAKVRGGAQVTKVGTTIGTFAYMSPEQARGDEVDQRADIWSFGIVLYEMLTGQLPFKGDYEQAVLYSILNEEPQSLSELSEEVPEDLVKVVQKTLAKRPDERYQNLSEVIADLKNLSTETVGTMSTTNKSTLESKTSIAVLPFANMSADPENEYFSEGLSEEIINALTKIKDLKVTARTSSFSFKGKDADIQEIGQKLKVENVLEGSVRQAGDRLRITAQLVKTQDGYHLWSERYDRVMDDVFAIQDEITLAIVDKLKIELMGEEKQAIVVHHTSNLEAYQLYLKGSYYRYTKNNVNSALPYFQQAVALDPSHVLSRVGLAEIYVLQYFYGFTRPHDAYDRACIELDAAFKIQPDSPEVLAVDAFNRLCHDRDWSQIEQQLRRAIGLNPVNVHSHAWYGILLTILGRHDEAKATMGKAQELDPLSPYPYAMTGLVFLNNGEVDRAIAAFEKALKIEPENMLGQWGFGATLVVLGRGDEAVESLEHVLDRSGRSMFFLGLFGWALAVAGQTDTAQKILEEFSARSGQEYGTLVSIAWLLAELGEIEKAWDLLWKAEEERQPLTLFLGLPGFDRLRTDSRIGKLKERMHLPS